MVKKIAIMAVFLWSSLALLGWIVFDRNIIADFCHWEPPMKLFTALCFASLSTSFFFLKQNAQKFYLLIDACKNLVYVFSCIIIANQVFVWGSVPQPPTLSQIHSLFFDFPSLATVLNFLLLCLYIASRSSRNLRRRQQTWPLLIVGISSLIALFGHLIKAPALYFGFGKSVGIAVDTAGCLFLLAWAAFPQRKIKAFFQNFCRPTASYGSKFLS